MMHRFFDVNGMTEMDFILAVNQRIRDLDRESHGFSFMLTFMYDDEPLFQGEIIPETENTYSLKVKDQGSHNLSLTELSYLLWDHVKSEMEKNQEPPEMEE